MLGGLQTEILNLTHRSLHQAFNGGVACLSNLSATRALFEQVTQNKCDGIICLGDDRIPKLHWRRDVGRIACKECDYQRTIVQHFDYLMLSVQCSLGRALIAASLATFNGLCFAV